VKERVHLLQERPRIALLIPGTALVTIAACPELFCALLEAHEAGVASVHTPDLQTHVTQRDDTTLEALTVRIRHCRLLQYAPERPRLARTEPIEWQASAHRRGQLRRVHGATRRGALGLIFAQDVKSMELLHCQSLVIVVADRQHACRLSPRAAVR